MAYQTNPVFEYFSDSDRITCVADAAITGKTFVRLVAGGADQAPRVAPAPAGSRPYGVAGWNVAAGEKVTVYRRGVVSVTTGAAITAGTGAAVGANGTLVAPATGARDYGLVHADAASGADAAVALDL